MEENEDLEIGEGWKEDEIKQSGGERTEERKPMEESLISTMEDKQQRGGVRDVSDGMLERKDEVRGCKETDMSMADSKADETSAMYSADITVDTGEKCISEPPGRISEPPGRIIEPPGVDGKALETCSSGTVDGGPKETWEDHQKGEQKVTARTDHARTAVQEQSCKVVLHDIQLQPGLAESAEVSAEEGEKMPVKDEGAVTVGVGGSDGKVSWVEELEEGIVEVHGEVVDEEEVEDDNPPTPTQDELVDTGEEEEEVMVGTTEEFQEEGEMGDHASLVARGMIGDYQERGTTESIITTTAEERRPTSEIDQGGAGQETTSVTDQPDSVPASEVTVGRRSRRSVSDRHSKDEDFVYFGIRRKSRQKSQSPTPSLQSNESESSHTSSRSSRSSRRNSGRSADTEEKKPEVTAIRKRHASQELPSTSVGEDRPRRSRRSSPPNRYSPSETATQRLPKRRKSPSPTPQSQHEVPSRRTSKREHYTRHSTSSNRDSDFIYDMPKRRSDRNSIEERPPKRKR
ncbi:hypothetical protein BSL78_07623 [Apostichopus japonicus]|uniref:Uncharacterized protein n=1 Tax=Stichopus japonicus TaxID=307972 RepID=A0A2G8L5C6_STIJA|nr:hypothetical protein BSL78_07623 [Apostichopus japonicus]